MAYTDQYALARDAAFLERVYMAMLDAATDIVNESAGTTGHAARFEFATGVLREPSRWTSAFAEAIAAEGSVTSGSTDAAIKTAVSAVWNGFSGVSL